MESVNRLAEVINEWRWRQRPRPYTVVQFAQLIGVSLTTVYKWLNGTSKPEIERLWTIHEKTGIPFGELAAAAGYGTFIEASQFLGYLIEHVDEQLPGSDAGERERFKHWLESLREGEVAGAVLVTHDEEKGRSPLVVAEERNGEYRTVAETEVPPGQ